MKQNLKQIKAYSMIISSPENYLSESCYFPYDSKLKENQGFSKLKLGNVADEVYAELR